MTVERNDPTASGFAPPPAGNARLSGNETEMLCFKAARGAGMSWGLAEEAGHAVRWLQARRIDGASALLAHLDWVDGRAWESVCPEAPDRLRPRGAGPLCPVALGATLSDLATLPEAVVGPVTRPVLTLPFLHPLACACGQAVAAAWPGGKVTVTPDGAVKGDVDALVRAKEASLELSRAREPEGDGDAQRPDHRPSARTLARLDGYAMKITVPASGSSRVDAGAGSGDND